MKLTARVYFQPEYFNRNCFCTIPACFKADIMEDLSDESRGSFFVPEGVGHTRQEAIDMLIGQLKANGLHGRLSVVDC